MTVIAPASPRSRVAGRKPTWLRPAALGGLFAVLLIASGMWHLTLGAIPVGVPDVVSALTGGNGMQELVVREVRLPRALVAAIVGAGLALAGVLTQTVTGNPLAAPDILGITAGASFLVVLSFTVLPLISGGPSFVLALIGAAGAALFVMLLSFSGTAGSMRDLRIVLVGVTISAFLLSLTQGLVILDDSNAEGVIFWLVGGVNNAQWSDAAGFAPVLGAALVASLMLSGRLNLLLLGDDMASSLGVAVTRVRITATIVVVVLAGAAVAVAGPIGFVGLIVPHVTRMLIGSDHRHVIPVAALIGAFALTFADALGHLVNPPYEVPVGVVVSLIGAPYFVFLARRSGRSAS